MNNINWKLLTAFEAVARHRNFSRAALELNVQQPAVSRRVAALESELGVALLRRTRPSATLTQEGGLLFDAVARSIAQVRGTIEQIRRKPDQNLVTVNTTIGFASCYLMKRLPVFRASNPDIAIELISRDQNNTYGQDTADIVVAFDHPDKLPGLRHVKIFPEIMVAAARPDVCPGTHDDLEALSKRTLLHLTAGLHHDDWRSFFAGAGADGADIVPLKPATEQRFTSFMVYLQAALNGDGIVLGWETLMQDYFDLGQLRPVSSRRVPSERGYFACLTMRARNNQAAIRFWHWLGTLAQNG